MSTRSLPAPPAPLPEYIFRGHQGSVHAMCFMDHDKYFASCDSKGMIMVWKMQTRRPVLQWKAHDDVVLQIAIYDGNKLVSQGKDQDIHIWRLPCLQDAQVKDTPECLFTLHAEDATFCRMSLYETEDDVLLCFPYQGLTSMIDVYSLKQRVWIARNIGEKESSLWRACMAVQLFVDKHVYLLAGYESGTVALWQLKDQEKDAHLVWHVKEHAEPVLDLAIDRATHTWAASTAADNQIVKYTLASPQQVTKTQIKKSGVASVDIRADGRIIATGGHDGRIRIFSAKKLQPLAILSYHRDSVFTVRFASMTESDQAKHWLIGGGKEERISLWNIY